MDSYSILKKNLAWFQAHIVVSLGSKTVEELFSYILGVAQANPDIHVFMDEVAFESGAMTTGLMKQLDKAIKPDNYFWVSCKKNRYPIRDDKIESESSTFFKVGSLAVTSFRVST